MSDSGASLSWLKKIKFLLQDIKPKSTPQSKWANDALIGHAELYEALDKVLEDLKAIKNHSFPFLQKVSKREAPDYYDVIKEPMDLGTMSKKLKSSAYVSKAEFQRDLDLIWSNCLYYNSDPNSVYRVHANKMREKAEELMKQVPNIRVRKRVEVEAEGYDSDHIEYADSVASGDQMNETDQQQQPHHHHQPKGMDAILSGLGMENATIMEEDSTAEAAGPTARSDTPQSDVPLDVNIQECLQPLARLSCSHDPDVLDIEQFPKYEMGELPVPDRRVFDAIRAVWESRAECVHARKAMQADLLAAASLQNTTASPGTTTTPAATNVPVSTTGPAAELHLPRSGWSMMEYTLLRDLYERRKWMDQSVREGWHQDELADEYFLPELFYFFDSVPDAYPEEGCERYFDLTRQNPQTNGLGVDLEGYDHVYVDEKALRQIKATIEAYRTCRALEGAIIGMARQVGSGMTSGSGRKDVSAGSGLTMTPVVPSLSDLHYKLNVSKMMKPSDAGEEKPMGKVDLDEQSVRTLLSKSVVLLLMQMGYDTCDRASLSILVDATTTYIQTLGRTYSAYSTTYAREMSGEEVLLHSLKESGVEGVSALRESVGIAPKVHLIKMDRLRRKFVEYFDMLSGAITGRKSLVGSGATTPLNEGVPETKHVDEAEAGVTVNGAVDALGDVAMREDFLGLKDLGVLNVLPRSLLMDQHAGLLGMTTDDEMDGSGLLATPNRQVINEDTRATRHVSTGNVDEDVSLSARKRRRRRVLQNIIQSFSKADAAAFLSLADSDAISGNPLASATAVNFTGTDLPHAFNSMTSGGGGDKYAPPATFPPVKSTDCPGMIGLIKPWFSEKLRVAKSYLVEDEYMPKPRTKRKKKNPVNSLATATATVDHLGGKLYLIE